MHTSDVDRDGDGERDERLKKIALEGRGARAKYDLPRPLWIMAIVMAVVCLVPFGYAWLSEPGELSHGEPPPAGSGMGTGIAIGFVAGVVVGFAVARARRTSGSGGR